MKYETVTVKTQGAAPDAELKLYLIDNTPEIDLDRKRPAVLILPGGGYRRLSAREAEPVALRMLALGYHAAVLSYSVAPHRFPAALLQTLAAVHMLRSHAGPWHIDAGKIAVMGFSAGGHAAASAAVFWSRPHYARQLNLSIEDVRPNAAALCYPVITSGSYAHRDSVENLLGALDSPYRDTVSLEKQVSEETAPCFLWHTADDACVPVENSLLFASALARKGVPFEMHIYAGGVHGLSLASREVYGPENQDRVNLPAQSWVGLFDLWLQKTL